MKNNIGTKELHIDKANYTPIATVKQEDNITMTLELYKEGVAFDITGQTVTLAAKRVDKVIIEQIDGFTIDTNRLTIDLKNNINAKIGLVYLELNIKDSIGSMTTLDFYLKVAGKILGEDSLDASNNIASLEKIQQDFINSSNSLLDTVTRNENTRVDAEVIRENNENTRNENEKGRTKAETNRVTEETNRVEAENLRATAEEKRVVADILRDEKVEKFGSQVTKNTKNIAENTKDIERAFETINDNSFLPFNGENVTVEHSKVGFTKDMFIEGMTYQNLLQSKKYWNSSSNQVEFRTIFKIEGSKILTACNKTNKKIVAFIFDNSTQTYITIDIPANSNVKIKLTNNQYLRDLRGIENWIENDINSNLDVLLLEGELQYIPPYFEDIKSVGEVEENKVNILSCGKNFISDKVFWKQGTYDVIGANNFVHSDIINIKKGSYIFSNDLNLNIQDYRLYKDGVVVTKTSGYDKSTVTIPDDINGIGIICYRNGLTAEQMATIHLQLEEGIVKTPYEPYKSDKRELKLPFSNGLKGLPSGAKDLIFNNDDGCYVRKKVEKRILNGSEDFILDEKENNRTINFYLDGNYKVVGANTIGTISDILPSTKQAFSYIGDNEGVWTNDVDRFKRLYVTISKSKLETQDVAGFKKWLQNNPITVYYELDTPIETKISDLNSINLETFKDMTHITSENEIQPHLSFKAPCDIPATISTLRSANTMLMVQNTELQDKNKELESVNKEQNKALKDISNTTDFLIEDALTRKLNN